MPSLTDRVRALFDGRPPALPDPVDRLAERWVSLPPRARLTLGVAAGLMLLLLAGAGAARSPWGPPVDVLVAVRDLPAGHRLAPEDLAPARWPAELVGARSQEPTGRTLTMALPAGTPVTSAHLGDGGPAAQLRDGEVAFPLPLEATPQVEPGQVVDLVAGDASGGGSRLAAAARILATDGTTVWVAVGREDAPGLAGAAAWGRVVAVPLPDRTDPAPR